MSSFQFLNIYENDKLQPLLQIDFKVDFREIVFKVDFTEIDFKVDFKIPDFEVDFTKILEPKASGQKNRCSSIKNRCRI